MTIADHPVTPEDIQSFVDGELSLDEARLVETHIATCAECTGIRTKSSSRVPADE